MYQVLMNRKATFTEDGFSALRDAILMYLRDSKKHDYALIIADHFLASNSKFQEIFLSLNGVEIIYHDSSIEPSTDYIDEVYAEILANKKSPSAVVGVGGGSALDTAKAVSNMLGNGGKAEDYQGWELLTNPGIYKIGVPTLFGTGAETSRTCVLLNQKKKLKLGMNSEYSLFDEVIVDSNLSLSSPLESWVFTAMDGYFHALEILRGRNRVGLTDEFAHSSLNLIKQGLQRGKIDKEIACKQISLGSFLGGIALANGTVGLVHPFSAALSVVFGTPHGIANCMAMKGLKQYYPEDFEFYSSVMNQYNLHQKLYLKSTLTKEVLDTLCAATIIHDKPLRNHLGDDWTSILNPNKMLEIYELIFSENDN